jgi:hypothetical protein
MRRALVFIVSAMAMTVSAALVFREPDDAPDRLVRAEIAGVELSFAPAYARDDATVAGGSIDRLVFIASFPEFAPVTSLDGDSDARRVTLTLRPKDDDLDPQERPAKLYARFLTPETLAGPGGLVLRRFESGSPYDSEELFVAPPDGHDFFARCPGASSRAPGEGCLSVFRSGSMDVELRYSPSLLGQWDALCDGARALLAGMRAAAGPPDSK